MPVVQLLAVGFVVAFAVDLGYSLRKHVPAPRIGRWKVVGLILAAIVAGAALPALSILNAEEARTVAASSLGLISSWLVRDARAPKELDAFGNPVADD
jgi:hypothetical protein